VLNALSMTQKKLQKVLSKAQQLNKYSTSNLFRP